jgi:hypothetical protein
MPRFLIERQLPGAGALSGAELQAISHKSVCVLAELGGSVQWVQSYVTPDAIYCVYIAPDEAAIREHAARGGFPVTRITEVLRGIDPTTAESPRPTLSASAPS